MTGTTSETGSIIDLSDDLDVLHAELEDLGWTDGLPVIPPTPERVRAMLDAVPDPPDRVLAELPPVWGEATVEKIAINAVMAGCRPSYLPVLIAAVEGMAEPRFNLYGIQDTTNPVTPAVIVNGPIRTELEMNAGTNAFGPGNRANATIGRAVRLILLNIGGAEPGRLDRSTQGQPAKYTFCAPEHEERNPWEPFHVEHGFNSSSSAATVLGVQGYHNIIDLTATTGEELLEMLAAGMAAHGTNNVTHGGETALVLSPEHADLISRDGFTKDEIRRYLFERARVDITSLPRAFVDLMATRRPRWVDMGNLPITDEPEEINLFVIGGPGIHAAFLPMFGSTRAVTEEIRRSE